MKRLEREHGRILSAETKFRGDALAEDALAGATTLVVSDAGDFDEDGGWLTINGQVVEYTECDDDEGVITLAAGLDAAADQGDAVHLWSEFYQEAVDYQEILVELDGEYDNPETVVAELADGLPDLPEGDRGRAGESCTLLRVSDDEWEVVNVGGRPRKSAGRRYEANDVYTLAAADITAGTATIPLSHRPINESLKAWWTTVPQEPTEYTVNYDTQTITWPLAGFEMANDRIWVHYSYLMEGVSPEAMDDSTYVVYTPPNAVFIASESQHGSTAIVGASPQWGDDSDATYASIWWRTGTGWLDQFSTVATDVSTLSPSFTYGPATRVALWLRWEPSNGLDLPMRGGLQASPGGTTYLKLDPAMSSGGLTAPAGWDVIELLPVGMTTQQALDAWALNPKFLTLITPEVTSEPAGSLQFQEVVYEARIAFYG